MLLLQNTAQVVVDTTDIGYQIGYKIGSYLPVALIIIAAVYFISKTYKFDK